MARDKQTPQDQEIANVPATLEQKKGLQAADLGYAPEDLASGGFEGMSAQDFSIPFLSVLQKMSPQVDEDSGKGIAGAKAGMVLNSVTNEMFDGKKGIVFIPVHRLHNFVEWIPRDQGGGFVGLHSETEPEVMELRREQKFGKLNIGDGNDLVETFLVYGLLVDEETEDFTYAVISFASTQIKSYKSWMTQAISVTVQTPTGQRVPAPLWSHMYRLTTRLQENKKGTWHGWDVRFAKGSAKDSRLEAENQLYIAAKAFRDMVTSDQVKANYESTASDVNNGQEADKDTF